MTSPISRTIRLHEASGLWAYYQKNDHLDCVTVQEGTRKSMIDLARMVFEKQPAWVEILMNLRNKIVKPFGLKTGHEQPFTLDEPDQQDPADCQTIGLFHIYHQSEKEILLGADDSHLDFRIVIRKSDHQVQLASWVRPHNWLGKTYLTLIMPFHHLIVGHSAKRIARAL